MASVKLVVVIREEKY